MRSELYMKILLKWGEEIECRRVLTVLAPPVFACYSSFALGDDGKAPAKCHNSITEDVLFAFARFLAAAHDVTAGVPCLDFKIGGNDCGVLFFLCPVFGARSMISAFSKSPLFVALPMSLRQWSTARRARLNGVGSILRNVGIHIDFRAAHVLHVSELRQLSEMCSTDVASMLRKDV